jgi:hypothetical protein
MPLEMAGPRAKPLPQYAARGLPECQYYEYQQAMTWCALAADRGVTDARRISEREKRCRRKPPSVP